jgi:protein-S-isoprenylcysteine O-methyltransferase Ste14
LANAAILLAVADEAWFVRDLVGQAILVTTNILWLVVVVGSVSVPRERVRIRGRSAYYYLWMAPMLLLLVTCVAEYSRRRPAAVDWWSPLPGLTMLAAGFALSFFAWLSIQKHVSTHFQIVEGHRVVDRGLYRHVRHPIYLSFHMIAIGVVLATWSVAGAVVFAVIVLPVWAHVIDAEERFLLQHLGTAYEEYRRRTKRLVPFIY